jgi:uncharacterized membrane-anchored protein
MTNSARSMLVKVPAVTAFFWIIKVLATTVGETFSDFINEQLGFGLVNTTIVMTIALIIVLFFQFRANRYIPALYWLAIVQISITGTLITDNLTDGIGFPLWASTLIFGALLVATFVIWWFEERTLSIKSIDTTRREAFYWVAILMTFAMGTAFGDYLGDALSLGFGVSALIFAGTIAVIAIGWRIKVIGEVLAFWLIYILTRPLGASIGDLLSQPTKDTGLGLGPNLTSLIFLVAILGSVTYLAISKHDQISK